MRSFKYGARVPAVINLDLQNIQVFDCVLKLHICVASLQKGPHVAKIKK